MFGCNNFCSYCIVPYVRGRERSRDPKAIIREIERLVADGVVEVMLLGQNVNSYGKNLEEPMTFAQLLQEIEKIEGLERIRFMTSHPKDLSDELIEVMSKSKKICKHLHLPVQSGSSRILKLMNRHYDKEQYLALAEKIRKAVPDISLTTDIIVGFPGETEEDFQETLDVVRKVRYDSAFTFIYSKRTGTPAAVMEDQIPEDVVKDRFNRLLHEVQTISAEQCASHEGTVQGDCCNWGSFYRYQRIFDLTVYSCRKKCKQEGVPFEERVLMNYDHPDSLETDLLVEHLKELKAGRAIDCPVYDYSLHNRSDEVI